MLLATLANDELYLECIHLAMQSKGKEERYGSIVVKEGEVIGKGWNRAVSHPSFRQKLQRVIRQGWVNHAEIEAMNDALEHDSIEDADIYVAGYFPQNGQLFFKRDYTCVRCPPHMKEYGIRNVYVPIPEEWLQKSISDAETEARKYINGTHEKRVRAVIRGYSIQSIVHDLLNPSSGDF